LLARIRDIRASERRFYQKITDIYATSIDYDPNAPLTQEFYATVQNKLHWAITGRTAAETVVSRADADKPNMGLTTWKNAPKGPVRKADITVAKNYLNEREIAALNRIVTMYLDYAEDQAARQNPMHMADWIKKLDAFLTFNDRNILKNAGKVSAAMAEEHARREFGKIDAARLAQEAKEPTSDFDKIVDQAKRLGKATQRKKEPGKGKLRPQKGDGPAKD
ncbi:MAG: RhuM family protein, partial [Planctomycetota bacterium]